MYSGTFRKEIKYILEPNCLSNRGKKKLTPEQKIISQQKQRNRIKVANLVARNTEINNKCCICGKPGRILHNINNPYYISFICIQCEKNENNIKTAIKNRKDIRQYLNKKGLSVKTFCNKDVIKIVEGFDKNKYTIGSYCIKVGITRYQFTQLKRRYKEMK